MLADGPSLIAIRGTDGVRRWWQGRYLAADLAADLAVEHVVRLTIETAVNGIVGLIQFVEEPDPEYRHASLDIYLDPAVHRRGLGSDAINTVVRHLVEDRGHHRLTIDPDVGNAAAIACYQRCGFETVGVMRMYSRQEDGSWRDGLLMEFIAAGLIDG